MNLSGTSEILRTMKTELPGVLSQWQNSMETDGMDLLEEDAETIFDKAYVRAIFITLYTLVFSFCFFGNLAVVLVVTLHWKMRSITKFCIGNLAFANLCVGIFCVYQNLSTFLIDRWVFGSFMCKMYHFINSLSHTTSILILVVICVERYVAILHPFKSRKWVTLSKLKVVIVTVWILSAIICAPRLYYINIINFPVTASPGKVLRYDMICAPQHSLYNAPMMDMGYFILLFILPLLVISILYTRISIYVWRSSRLFRGGSTGASFGSESYTSQKSTISVTQKFNRFSRSCSKRERRTVRFSTTFEDDSNSFKDNDRESPENDSLISDLESTGSTVFSDSLEPPPSKCSHARIRFSVRLSIFRRSGSKKQRCRSKGNSSGSPKTLKKNPLQSSRQEFKEVLTPNFPRPNKSRSPFNNNDIHFEDSSSSSAPGKFPRRKISKETYILNSSKILHRKFCRRSIPCCGDSSGGGRIGGKNTASRWVVVRMMIVVVVSFALCNLPFHVRKICISYMPDYEIGSTFSNLLAPMTFLLMYANCAINPIIYAFMSKDFRSSFLDLIRCQLKRNFSRRQDSNTAVLNVVHNVV